MRSAEFVERETNLPDFRLEIFFCHLGVEVLVAGYDGRMCRENRGGSNQRPGLGKRELFFRHQFLQPGDYQKGGMPFVYMIDIGFDVRAARGP